MPASSVVFDSWALLALLQGEAAAKQVRELMLPAARGRRPRLVASVNLGEVWYNVARRRSEAEADEHVSALLETGLEVVDAG